MATKFGRVSLKLRNASAGVLGRIFVRVSQLVAWGLGIFWYLFNQALLAKQGWRLITNLNSLANRMLKGCYFPNSSFLQASRSSSGSFVWRSLLWGRDLIEQGFRWRIGDRSSVYVYNDRWIARPHSFKVYSSPTLHLNVTVRDLKLPSGC
ncbi:hypothetical protein ACOSQ2_014494 [Xanthoceras sorbifolium]